MEKREDVDDMIRRLGEGQLVAKWLGQYPELDSWVKLAFGAFLAVTGQREIVLVNCLTV
jgi:hypothetical protein